MKKSKYIILSSVMFSAITACSSNDNEWTTGKDQNGRTRDTSIYKNGGYHHYRYYGGGWFPISRNNTINTGYAPASVGEIVSPSFSPRSASGRVRTGGFGSSAHSSHGG
jgi:hypothetical protein